MRSIGYDKPCFIIAEAGINHNGDISIAKDMALAAKTAGADAVKYQTFRRDELPYRNINYSETINLKEYCDEIGITFLSTPHSYSAIEFLYDLVPMYKVASPKAFDIKFMRTVLDKGKPVIVSFNEYARNDDIAWLMSHEVYPMHTVCMYPARTPMDGMLNARRSTFWERPWGYSDHCCGPWGCITAFTEARPAIIEKHFKLLEDCVDAKHSIFPAMFKDMVEEIREMEKAKSKALSTD